MDNVLYCLPILFLMILGKREQKKVFFFFLCLFFVKMAITYLFAINYQTHDRFLINNTSRLVLNLLTSLYLIKYSYNDVRCILPIIVLSSISVVYFLSNIFILLDNWYIQNIIFNYSFFFGSIIILSLIDLGQKNYEILFNNIYMRDNKFSSYLSANLPFQINEEIKGAR